MHLIVYSNGSANYGYTDIFFLDTYLLTEILRYQKHTSKDLKQGLLPSSLLLEEGV
jgi:hypothetical protein